MTLVVFCRRPEPGIGKQRIAAGIGAAAAAELSHYLLATALEDAASWPGPAVISPASAADEAWAAKLLSPPTQVVPQLPGNLGARLNRVDRRVRQSGASRLIFIGSDAPLLDEPYYTQARAALDRTDVVLGPAEDGGVTLMGARVAWPELGDLPWSTTLLREALHRRCIDAGLSVTELPTRYDIDEVASLARLDRDLVSDARPARLALRRWIGALRGVSVIVPVLGETRLLRGLLKHLRAEASPGEIIVVDGGGDPQCRALCDVTGARYLPARKGRGHQLHLGALEARGEVLWFLHADASPPPGAVAMIRNHLRRGAVGGYFRFGFTGPRTWYKSLLSFGINLRTRFGVPYGDQGLFMTRAAYRRAGGFPDDPLFEEVPLVRAVRKLGRFAALDATIGVSPRRWERDGWMRRTIANRLMACGYMIGIAPQRLVRGYRPLDTAEAVDPPQFH